MEEETSQERRERQMSERRRLGIRELTLIATLLLNFGGLVWGAATLYAATGQLSISVNTLNTTVKDLASQLQALQIDYNARISVLEAQARKERKP